MRESDINKLMEQGLSDSQRWFPSVHESVTFDGHEHAILHFALGVGGEAGEIVNKVKKWAGYKDQSEDFTDTWLKDNLSEEIPDAVVYLFDLAAELGIDLPARMDDKHGVCMTRWEPGYTWNSVPVGHVVPGSGEIIVKTPHAGGWHVKFKRLEVFPGETWSRYHSGDDLVPVALTSKGLLYPSRKNVLP